MKTLRLLLFTFLCFAVGCGGAPKNIGTTTSPGLAQLQGNWKIVLGENQAATIAVALVNPHLQVDPNPTAIAISLVQSNTILSASSEIYSGNAGCASSPSFWYSMGTWGPGLFSSNFGSVSGSTIILTLDEADPLGAHGQIELIGTVQSDGSISGNLTDSCILDYDGMPTHYTFTARKISTFPPTSWP